MTRMQQKYQQEVISKLQQEFGLTNIHQVPTISKVVLNVGVGRASGDNKTQETVLKTLRKITGQQPLETVAKNSVAGFKLRKGQKIGFKVTLRSVRMWEFLDRLLSLVLPRTRDFHGLPRKAFDASGNYSIGITDQSVFPELSYEDTALIHGLQINVVTTSDDKALSARLLELLGFPLEKSREALKAEAQVLPAKTPVKTKDNKLANDEPAAQALATSPSVGG